MFKDLLIFLEPDIMMGLLLLWAALLFGGFIFGKLNTEQTRRMPIWTRLASSFVLVAIAWYWYQLFPMRWVDEYTNRINYVERDIFGRPYVFLIAIGMTLGFIGDIFMSRKNLVGGLSAFGLGHIAYIIAFVSFRNRLEYFLLNNIGLTLVAWVVWLIIGVIAWYITVYRSQPRTLLHWAALAYCLLLSSTAGFATGLALQNAVFIPLAIGAALFLFSDLLITVQLFMHKTFYLIDDVVWLTYGPAQALIVYSVYAALLVVSS
jgi:hypothetical protein